MKTLKKKNKRKNYVMSSFIHNYLFLSFNSKTNFKLKKNNNKSNLVFIYVGEK